MTDRKFDDSLFADFEQAWANGERPDVKDFAPDVNANNYLDVFTELARIDMELSWERGNPRTVEHYQQRYPAELANKLVLRDIAFEEYRLRSNRQQSVSAIEYADRYGIDASQWPVYKDVDRAYATEKPDEAKSSELRESSGAVHRSREGSEISDTDSDLLFGEPLQRRLRLVSICTASLFTYLLLLVLINPEEKVGLFLGSWLTISFNLASLAVAAGFYLLLQFRRVSTRTLRRIELLLFGITLANFSLGYFSDVIFDHELVEPISQGDHALFHYSSSWTLPFFVLIIVYGTLIPSSLKRCLIAVCGIAVIPILISIIAVTLEGGWSISFVVSFLFQMVIWMAIGISIATYGVRRINSLRQILRKGAPLGSYQLGRLLSFGGMGEVYEATHTMLKRQCAIKVLKPSFMSNEVAQVRFEREVRTMAEINHPNIVQIFDFGRADDGSFFYVMEFLKGQTLAQCVTGTGPMNGPEAVPFMLQVLAALEAMHNRGIVHRDITPSNIFLSENSNGQRTIKLIDFGLVHVQDQGLSSMVTLEGSIVGTPAYMSPEQAAGAHVDWRSDIYSFAAVCYFMLNGTPPFERPSVVETLNAHIREPIVPIDVHHPDLDAVLSDTINRCLAKDPAYRFTSTNEIRSRLMQL